MDKEFKLSITHKQLVKYVNIAVMSLLLIVETLICAQFVNLYLAGSSSPLKFAFVIIFCAALIVITAVDIFAVKKIKARFTFFGIELLLLLAISLLTGNSYLATLYCIVLTHTYLALDDIKQNIIIFAVSCVLYVASFVCGWVIVHKGASLYESIIQIFGDCFFGVLTLTVHGAIETFILKYYSNNAKLRHALKETDESRQQLKEVYEQLSRTAVFEERNRIAKDIHDNVGHSMTTVIMQTEAAKLLIEKDPAEAKNAIVSANITAKNALEQIRESVHLLAGRMQNQTLKEQLEEVIAQTIDGTGLKVRCDIEEATLDPETTRFVLNTVKECFANGVRHGKATAFYVELKKSENDINLLISDNGVGAGGDFKEGFGLKGIRAKVEGMGGKCSFSGVPDEGFEAEIVLPYKQ